jgi:hypothetical protein
VVPILLVVNEIDHRKFIEERILSSHGKIDAGVDSLLERYQSLQSKLLERGKSFIKLPVRYNKLQDTIVSLYINFHRPTLF